MKNKMVMSKVEAVYSGTIMEGYKKQMACHNGKPFLIVKF